MILTEQNINDAKLGSIEAIQSFLASNPSKSNIRGMINLIALYGHTECVKMMLPHSVAPGSHIKHNDALRRAASKGHASCVELLIPVSSSHGRTSALCAALEGKHPDCIELLLAVSDLQAALETLQFEYSEEPQLYEDLQCIIAQQQKQVLNNAVGATPSSNTQANASVQSFQRKM